MNFDCPAVAALYLAPLRERPSDILPLARHFLTIHGERSGYGEIKLSPATSQSALAGKPIGAEHGHRGVRFGWRNRLPKCGFGGANAETAISLPR